MRILMVLLICCLALPGQVPPLLDEWVTRAQKEFEVPGMAVGIVKDGKVVALKGYGVRKLGNPGKVDAQTLFGIASNTKAFTTAALAMLVDEGKLKWDDRVIAHLPGFRLWDPYVTRELRVRDLVTHRTGLGLGAGDLMFWPDTTFTREQVLAGAGQLKPKTSFRSAYAYNNTMFVVAGQVIEAVSKMKYEEFVKARIFAPVGMGQARMSNVGLSERDNTAVPHSRGWRLEGELKPISWTQDDVWAAAAGVKANVTDLAKWMNVQLAEGKIDESRRLFSERMSRMMFSAQVVMGVGQQPKNVADQQAQFAAYGLGWFLKDYRGTKVAYHGGGLTGMVTQTTLVPSLKLGIVVLTNQEEGGAFQAVTNLILDHYLSANGPDWIGALRVNTLEQRKKVNAEEAKAMAARNAASKPTLELAAYAQTYEDGWYGKATIAVEGGALRMKMAATPAMQGRLEHFQYDTFLVKWDDTTLPDAYCQFRVNREGKVEGLKMEAVSDLADFSFDYHDLDFQALPRKN
jgi:CubicO group peptidase (beta-lactamase class C family)